jgi:hypothetical protein
MDVNVMTALHMVRHGIIKGAASTPWIIKRAECLNASEMPSIGTSLMRMNQPKHFPHSRSLGSKAHNERRPCMNVGRARGPRILIM